ncbi:threonine-tRNA ligase [Candidatus Phycosocius bacilliformis]|uniref:Threonine--tRNA ligase n=1 Tax=Candidatus Phycosocius bacilliformis TaxID=1445552 RepID=A0A2P2E6S7_9PROT|nr:threonine--tRNA ligase [Candidatus Phycosocius bacilliformis]GBF56774.1 threonine-tRNA ligase [Candidatus Phycosocius bacilliformis]
MIQLQFPDGAVRPYDLNTTPLAIAEGISKTLAKKVVAAKIDGDWWDLTRPLDRGGKFELVTRDSADGLEVLRHDAAHVLAQAVQELFPGTQVTIGPTVEDGFYYDFYRAEKFSTDDFEAIEKRMREIVDADLPIIREEMARDEAIGHFNAIGETFKANIIDDIIPPGEVITVYRQGETWKDLCRGPHLPSTGRLGKAFKLMKLAGAYWRGDPKNPQLQRIYGTAWADEKQLAEHLMRLEEAEKRDHRKIGRALDLFHFQEEAQGSVFWHPKGYMIWRTLEAFIRRQLDQDGYVEVKTPQLLASKFWEQSGHWEKFRENMFVVPDEAPSIEDDAPIFSGDADLLALKPMNCPAHIQIFKSDQRSYRDLPIRMAEFGCCHRNEANGALHGLMRVRQMTQDDAHIFCREDQIGEETKRFLNLFNRTYQACGLTKIEYRLATRPEKRAGSDKTWDKAEKALADALSSVGVDFSIAEGDGAFYGPKLEFHLTDAIGRTWQCGTFQLDYVLPERLDAVYTGEDGQKHRPVMLHRAVFGTFERFIGIMIENYAGALPTWLAPVQVVVATITSEADAYAEAVAARLRQAGIRVETDLRNEKINYKVREHSLDKVPVMAIVGRREAEEGKVALRRFGSQAQEFMGLDEAVGVLREECLPPDLKDVAA